MSILWLLVAGLQFFVAVSVLLWNLSDSPVWDGRVTDTSPTWAALQFAPVAASMLIALVGVTLDDRRPAAALWLFGLAVWAGTWAVGFSLAA